MKKLSARRRHPLAAVVVLLLALAATGGLYAAFAPAGTAKADETAQSLAIEEGKKLYSVGCASCHGTGGQGTSDGPSLVGVGSASVDFQVGTGRMPAQQPGAQVPKKKVIYSQADIDQLAAYVASSARARSRRRRSSTTLPVPTSPRVASCSATTVPSATTSPVRAAR